jgi:hypothetical protein
MDSSESEPPVVTLPERVDRQVRLGPFPSARDAVKFVCYATAGAVLAPLVSPWAWIPALGFGFVVSVWRPEGDAIDVGVARWFLFHARRGGRRMLMPAPSAGAANGVVARLADGRAACVVRTAGTPLAYRPPEDLQTLFDRFREMLRASEGPVFVGATTVPLRAGRVRPPTRGGLEAERPAMGGYGELVSALCRHRQARRVDLAVCTAQTDDPGRLRLEERARALAEHLAALGLAPSLLSDRGLAEALRRLGWTVERGTP